MWIRDKDGDYYNMDCCSEICYDSEFNVTRVCINHNRYVLYNGDLRGDLIANIISGTKIMEVR